MLEEFDSQSTVAGDMPVNPVRINSYTYDGVGRLKEDNLTDRSGTLIRTTTYGYDKVGNRTQKAEVTSAGTETTAYTYDSNDRLTQETRTTSTGSQVQTVYACDTNGNLVSKAVGAQIMLYGWNNDNRLIEVKQGTSAAAAQTVAKYTYDPNGNRVTKIEPGQNGQADKVTGYLVDTTFEYAQVVQESVVQGQATESVQYVWGKSLIAQTRAGQGTFYHADGLGSVKALSDVTGSATDTYAYDAFGNVANKSGATSNPYRYTGEYFDDLIGLQYNRARWYGAEMGRFVSQDDFDGTARRPVTLNKFVYANADPVNVTDPSGHFGLGEISVASNIQSTLANLQMDFGFNMIGGALNSSSDGPGVDDVAFGMLGVLVPQTKIIAKLSKKPKQLKLNGVAKSSVLGDNLRVMGKLPSNSTDQAHHIVAGTAGAAKPSRDILDFHKIDINAPGNGVWLPKTSHCGGHCNNYYNEVNRVLQDAHAAGGKPAVMAALQDLERRLITGELRVDK